MYLSALNSFDFNFIRRLYSEKLYNVKDFKTHSMKNFQLNKKLYLAIALTIFPFFLFYLRLDLGLIEKDFQLFLDQFALITANIIGYIGATLIIWQFVLGIRHIAKYLSHDLITINKVHKVIGKYGVLLIPLHPILQKGVYLKPLSWIFIPNFINEIEFHISLGRFAYALIWFIWITSVLLKGKLKYRPWKYLHFLTYPLLILVLFHIRDIGTFYKDYAFMQALWITVLIFVVLMLILRLLQGSGYMKKRYTINSVSKYGDEIFVLDLSNPENKIQPKIGQFIYVQISSFGESHPFTVMDYDKQTGNIILGIRDVGRFSYKLSQLGEGHSLLLDGPYGVFTSEVDETGPIVILAGGIGITPFAKFVRESKNENLYLFYSNKKNSDVLMRDEFQRLLGDRFIECITQEEIEGVLHNRIDGDVLTENIPEKIFNDAEFMICGSPNFVEGMKDTLEGLEIEKERIHYEEFNL
jgi:predicted ferric reductase